MMTPDEAGKYINDRMEKAMDDVKIRKYLRRLDRLGDLLQIPNRENMSIAALSEAIKLKLEEIMAEVNGLSE